MRKLLIPLIEGRQPTMSDVMEGVSSAVLRKMVLNMPVEDDDIADDLYEICDRVHSCCDNECPVYEANGFEVPREDTPNRGCKCFKDGKAMLTFLRQRSLQGVS